MNKKRSRLSRVAKVRFALGQHVGISKEKKGSEQNFMDEIFRIAKVIRRTLRPVYELEDLNGTSIEGQFYGGGTHAGSRH